MNRHNSSQRYQPFPSTTSYFHFFSLSGSSHDSVEDILQALKRSIYPLLISILLVFMSACNNNPAEVALKSKLSFRGLSALKKLNNQDQIYEVAYRARNEKVQIAAVEKLTNQELLTDLVQVYPKNKVGRAAALKITDQYLIGQILINNALIKVHELFKNKITDPAVIMFMHSFDSVPSEYRPHLYKCMKPAIRLLGTPEVFAQTGKIVAIKPSWYLLDEDYRRTIYVTGEDGVTKGTSDGTEKIQGENFIYRVKLEKIDQELYGSWKTDFPYNAESYARFYPAPIDPGEFLSAVFSLLPQALLQKIAFSDDDPKLCRGAARKITDRVILSNLVLQNKYPEVRSAVVDLLSDQALLEKVAVNDTDYLVRIVAVHKLKNQAVLAEIWLNDTYGNVADAAYDMLTDQTILTDIATKNENPYRRIRAIQKLNDQSVLQIIATDAKDSAVRVEANDRLKELLNLKYP